MRTMKNAMGDYGTITVVVRQHFVSIYGHDFIRSESVKDELKNFVEKLRVPGLGVALWQNYNFQIYAVSDVGNMPMCFGEYWFDEDDVTPVDAESVCETICAPFMLSALQKVLTSKEGDEMAGVFEEETGLQIYMDDDMCRNENLEELYHSDKLTIFSALS